MEELREPNDAYYRTETEGVNECKVIFLGDGTAGKSSLIERMVNDTLFVFTRYENALVTTEKMWYNTSKERRKAAVIWSLRRNARKSRGQTYGSF